MDDAKRLIEGKLDDAQKELNEGRGMVDLLPQPEEGDEGEMWARKTRESHEERTVKERYRLAVEKAMRPKEKILQVY